MRFGEISFGVLACDSVKVARRQTNRGVFVALVVRWRRRCRGHDLQNKKRDASEETGMALLCAMVIDVSDVM